MPWRRKPTCLGKFYLLHAFSIPHRVSRARRKLRLCQSRRPLTCPQCPFPVTTAAHTWQVQVGARSCLAVRTAVAHDRPRWFWDAAGSEEEGYRISQEFVTAMLEEFRQQRKVHVRFAFQIVMDMLAQLQTLPTLVDVAIPDGSSFTVCGVSLLL